MFSRRFPKDLKKNRLTLRLEKLRENGQDILDLTVSNPTQVGLSYNPEDLSRALGKPSNALYQPDPRGAASARQCIIDYYRSRHPRDVDLENIFLTASTSEAYSFLFKLLLDPGDNVLVPQPGYPLFDFLGQMESVETRPYLLAPAGREWILDWRSLENSLDDSTRAVIVVHPGNPTGHYLRQSQAHKLSQLCSEKRLALIYDEVFSDFALDKPAEAVEPVAETTHLTFVLNGLSKMLALPQLKLAWILVRGPSPICDQATQRLELIGDTYLSVNTPVQSGLAELLSGRRKVQSRILARLRSNWKTLEKTLINSSLQTYRPEGGWSAILRLPQIQSGTEWAHEILEREKVLAHPGELFGLDGANLVVSLLPESETFETAIGKLKSRVECRVRKQASTS